MNCETALPLLYDLVDDDLSEQDRPALNQHLAGCQACQLLLNSIQSAESIYRNEVKIDNIELPPTLAARISDQVLAQVTKAQVTKDNLTESQLSQLSQQPTSIYWSTRAIAASVGAIAAGLAAMLYLAISLPVATTFSDRAREMLVSFNPTTLGAHLDHINHNEILQTVSELKIDTAITQLVQTAIGSGNALVNKLPINSANGAVLLVLVALQLFISYRLLVGGENQQAE